MKHSRLHRWITVAGFVLSLLGGARYAIALHTQSPPVTQVTSQTSGTIGKSAVWGDVTWAFQASGDSLGTGNATTELFTYEHDLRMLGGAFGLTQVTCGGFLPDNPSVSTPSFGDALAFDAIGTLCADGRNNCVAPFDAISTARQIYLYTPNTGQIRQLTHCAGDCANPGLSQNARMIVFESTADVLGVNGGAPLPKMHVYQGNLRQLGPGCPMLPCAPGRADRGVTNLTFPYGGRNASQNFTGKYVAYESDGDPLNNGALSGVPHVYVLNVRQRLLEQVPQAGSAIPARKPSLDQGGRRLVYEADVQRPGPSPAVVTEIFASRLRHNRVPLTISLTPNADANSYDPVMGPTGRRATFTSEADLLGRGSTGKQIFGYAFVGTPAFNVRHLLQVTGGPAGSERSVQSAFLFAGFASSDDFVANGNATPQFFVANLYKRAPGSVLSPLPGTPTARPSTTPRPTATPIAGVPDTIGMALVTNQAIDNHDNTLTTIIAATVRDYFGNPVADGTAVHFGVPATASGIVVGNGFTNADPDRDVTSFAQQTGIQIENRPGVAHVCVTYPGALSTTSHTIIAAAGPQRCVGGGTPWAACANDGDCSAKHACSVHTQTACDPFGGNVAGVGASAPAFAWGNVAGTFGRVKADGVASGATAIATAVAAIASASTLPAGAVVVSLTSPTAPLGASLEASPSSPGDVVVSRVSAGGGASSSGVGAGWRLVSVSGVRAGSLAEAVALIKSGVAGASASSPLRVAFAPPSSSSSSVAVSAPAAAAAVASSTGGGSEGP